MDVLHELPRHRMPRSAVAFGNFDGVHLGHRALIATLQSAPAAPPGGVTVVTFDPHPLALLRPERAPASVDTLAGRLLWLARMGVQRTVVLRFDAALRRRSATWFAREVIFGRLNAAICTAGPDSRFGEGGQGDLALLAREGAGFGARVLPCPPAMFEGTVVSSSRVRKAVAAGQIPLAEALLGRPFCLRGPVVHGDGLGAKLGFATANLAAAGQVLPPSGVYAGWLETPEGTFDAVANIGHRPTVGGREVRVEAHALDWQGDLYGRQVSLHLIVGLREERRFGSLDALVAAIAQDCQRARAALNARPRPSGLI